MKKVFFSLLIFLSYQTLMIAAPDTWVQKKDIGYYQVGGPQATNFLTAFSIGTKGYIHTADDDMENTDLWEYDPSSNLWSQKADFPGVRRTAAVGFGVGSKGYYGTGFNGSSYLQDFWEYDPSANAWTAKASLPGTARSEAVGFQISTKGYVGLGGGSAGYLSDFWEYTPFTNSWVQRLSFPGTARVRASGVGISTKGYVGLGVSSANVNFADMWEYSAVSNTWLAKAAFPGAARNRCVAFLIGSKAYFGLGGGAVSNYADMYEYDPAFNSWSTKASFAGLARSYAVGFSIGTNGYAGLGSTTGAVVDFWKYDSGLNSWSEVSAFAAVNRLNPAGFCINEKIYFGTGDSNDKLLNDLWEWDPGTELWTQKADFIGVARYNAISFAINGKGYLGLGTAASGTVSDFYQYDPVTNVWTAKASFGGGTRTQAAGFAIGDKGYVGTGASTTALASVLNDFWEYNPTTNLWTQKANFGGVARYGASGFAIGTKGYLGAGGGTGTLDDFWEYNPATNTWIQKSSIPFGVNRWGSGFSLGAMGYIAGGDYAGFMNRLIKYDPLANTWVQKNDMPFDRYRGFAISSSTRAYYGGGSNMSRLMNDMWEYEPENQIVLSALASNNYCAGDSIHISFSVLSSFSGGNVFTAQLSSLTGSFSSPTTLGTLTSTTSGTISTVIPSGLGFGNEYRIRVVASSPVLNSNDNGADLTIRRFEKIVFTEQMGSVGATTAISAHEAANGFDNDSYTMTGTGDIRNTVPSAGYSDASGNANMFFNTINGRTFQIEGINTAGLTGLQLRFGIHKNGVVSTSDLPVLEVSSNGSSYAPLTYSLPSGTGTATWFYKVATGTIPSTTNLRIRFTQTSLIPVNMYRIDDIRLTASDPGAGITSVLPNYICNGSSVALNATAGYSYLWSNTATTQATNVNTVGPHKCTIGAYNGCSIVSNSILLVDTTPAMFSMTGGGSYCSVPGTGVAVGLSGSEIGTNYQLLLDVFTPIGSPMIGNGTPLSFGLKTAVGSYTVAAIDVFTGCSIYMSGSVNVSATPATTYYVDSDGDGYGTTLSTIQACSPPIGYVANSSDCNDADTTEHPGQVWFIDTDEDDYGNGSTALQCARPLHGYIPAELTATTGDCNNSNAFVFPGAPEICNGIDDDCDNYIDEGCGTPIYCIGPSASYTPPSGPSYANQFSPFPSMSAAIAFLNTWSPTQHVIFEIQNNYTSGPEIYPIAITYSGNASATAVFRPRSDVASMITISGSLNGGSLGLFHLDGADYITFDGSPGGILGTTSNLMCRNTASSGTASANFLLKNDATHNVINAMTIEGGNAAANCILLGSTLGSTGNDFNSIQNCNISNRSDLGVSNPNIAIYSFSSNSGPSGNSDNSITGNKIINISDGVVLSPSGSNGNWTISNNHFYFTIPSSFKISEAISVNSNEPLTATITSNYIGGSAPFAAGSPMVETSSGLGFNGIYLNVSNTSPKSIVSGNTIKNYLRYSTGLCSFQAIAIGSGPVDVINNTIGDPSVSDDLSFISGVDLFFNAIIYISTQNSLPVTVSGNTVNNVTIQNTLGTSGSFIGILYSNEFLSSATATLSDNIMRNINYADRNAFTGMFVTPSESATVSAIISNNKFETFTLSSGVGAGFKGIYCDRGNAIISGNRIGKFSTPNDILINSPATHYGIRISKQTLGNGLISNDTLANINFTNSSSANVFFGIYMTTNGSTQNEVSGNCLKNISCAGTKSGVETDSQIAYELTGIFHLGTGSGGNVVSNNSIQGLNATTTSAVTNPIVSAISISRVNGAGSVTVSGNTIHSLTNTAANTTTLPIIIGISMFNVQSTSSFVTNNMISLSNAPNSNAVKMYGIYDALFNGFAGNTKIYHYNSIAIGGTTSGNARSAAFWHNPSSATLNLRNNILHNTRSGGTGKQYAVVHESGSAVTWIPSTSNYNNLYTANSATLGAWPLATDKDFATWKSTSGGDANSKNVSANFVNSASDLHLNPVGNCDLESTGQAQLLTLVDFDGQSRHATTPDIGADEFTGVCTTLLNVKAFIEGFYNSGGMMFSALDPGGISTDCDTLILELAMGSPPYTIQYSDTSILQTNGNVQFSFPSIVSGNSYHLVLKHRNALSVWSSNPVLMLNGFTYDFSTSSSQAYGSNQKLLSAGIFGLYSGDVNQDALVESTDYQEIENGSQAFLSGYVPTDLTGDWLVESADYGIMENNSQLFLFVNQP
ncbi:MAG: hypothetical protein IPO49_15760 [Bacteroidetes bacterium]|nr:hypothetical protein [Bacteroidota bacterium]